MGGSNGNRIAVQAYVACVVLVFVLLLLVIPIAVDGRAAATFERRFGAPWRPAVAAATLVVMVAVVALGVLGTLPFGSATARLESRALAARLVVRAVLLAAATVSPVIGASNLWTVVG